MTSMTQPQPALATTLAITMLTAATAALGAAVSGANTSLWEYAMLLDPELNLNHRLMGLVWPGIFVLMTVSAVIVRVTAGSYESAVSALRLYFLQLALLLASYWFLFGLGLSQIAFAALIALFVLITLMMRSFARHSKTAMFLLVPYLIWIGFSCYLVYLIISPT